MSSSARASRTFCKLMTASGTYAQCAVAFSGGSMASLVGVVAGILAVEGAEGPWPGGERVAQSAYEVPELEVWEVGSGAR